MQRLQKMVVTLNLAVPNISIIVAKDTKLHERRCMKNETGEIGRSAIHQHKLNLILNESKFII